MPKQQPATGPQRASQLEPYNMIKPQKIRPLGADHGSWLRGDKRPICLKMLPKRIIPAAKRHRFKTPVSALTRCSSNLLLLYRCYKMFSFYCQRLFWLLIEKKRIINLTEDGCCNVAAAITA